MIAAADIRVVLVETSHPGNIGAVARAMKNMGLEKLVLVRLETARVGQILLYSSEVVDDALDVGLHRHSLGRA